VRNTGCRVEGTGRGRKRLQSKTENSKIMNGKNRYKGEKQGTSLVRNSWDDPGFEMLLSPGDSALFGKIGDYIKGLSDIKDVKSDPAYSCTNDTAIMMISDYQENSARNRDNDSFIHNSLAKVKSDEDLKDEIDRIKHEISDSNINDISSEWVKEWHEKRQRNSNKDSKTEEIRNFINGSLKQDDIGTEIGSDERKKSGLSKSLITRYTSLAAAAIIGAVFLVRSFLPSNDPQKMFSKYYEPFKAVYTITRSTGANESESFHKAIGSYKAGDYKAAAAGFSEAMLNGSESYSAGFYLGITEIELGNYIKAIDLLGGVVNLKGEFTKEATWYLGLAYTKSGNKIKASECFELLARSPGFYSNRSEKILRLLR
jgi:TolA-binding protein